jgi:hypothetical protein
MCTLTLLPSPHFLECNLGKNTQKVLLVFLLLLFKNHMVAAKDALEFNVEEGFFSKQKKMSNFYFN